MKRVYYRSYLLEGFGWQLRTGGYSPEGRIWEQDGGTIRITPVYSSRRLTFPKADDAEYHALELGRVWIDHNR